jgi:hypothetical protein
VGSDLYEVWFQDSALPRYQAAREPERRIQAFDDVPETEEINPSYVSPVVRMTLLAPQIVEAVLAGRQRPELMMARAMRPLPLEWKRQGFASM